MSHPAQPRWDAVAAGPLAALGERAREVFRSIVDAYLLTGEPVGSKQLSRVLPLALSPASIRSVMADLEALGLVYAPHTSAGRMPTQTGLRFFVDAMMELGDVADEERRRIEAEMRAASRSRTFEEVLAEAGSLLSGLTRGAGLVVTRKGDARLKHIDFVRLDAERALAVLVGQDGGVENRVIAVAPGLPATALVEAANYLNARIAGRTLGEARHDIAAERAAAQSELDGLTERLVDAGLASWAGAVGESRQLIVRGQANLLDDLTAMDELERIRMLFCDLETKTEVIELLDRAEDGEGVRIFIGSENRLFSLSGSATIAAPFRDGQQRIVGVLGIIGPTRLNYARVVPMVDFTARVVSDLVGGR